jgi:hypothetical protein
VVDALRKIDPQAAADLEEELKMGRASMKKVPNTIAEILRDQ